MWLRIEELAKRNPNYAPLKNSIEPSYDENPYGEQEPDIDMPYDKMEAESKEVTKK